MPVTWSGDSSSTSPTNVWPSWCATTSGSTTNTLDPWPWWNLSLTTTASTTNGYAVTTTSTLDPWPYWVSTYTQTVQIVQRTPTPEELAAAAAAQARYAAEAKRAAEAEAEARARAETLLRSMLTSEQIAELAARAWFEVVAQSGRRYRICRGRSGNVHGLNDKGLATHRYCIHPGELVPDADTMLTQKLLLECDEAAFLRIANMTTL